MQAFPEGMESEAMARDQAEAEEAAELEEVRQQVEGVLENVDPSTLSDTQLIDIARIVSSDTAGEAAAGMARGDLPGQPEVKESTAEEEKAKSLEERRKRIAERDSSSSYYSTSKARLILPNQKQLSMLTVGQL